MFGRWMIAASLSAAVAFPAAGALACGQDVKDVQGMIPNAALGDKAEADAKALITKALELCTQGKDEEAKPYIDQARLVANIG